jgi:hypothetical protein
MSSSLSLENGGPPVAGLIPMPPGKSHPCTLDPGPDMAGRQPEPLTIQILFLKLFSSIRTGMHCALFEQN